MWESIGERNPDSRLREDESGKSFLPFKIKKIIDTIIHDYRTGTERVEIVFEGTNEEYREVEKVCLSEGVADKVVLTRTHRPECVDRMCQHELESESNAALFRRLRLFELIEQCPEDLTIKHYGRILDLASQTQDNELLEVLKQINR